jgi:hypothetical protein
MELGRNDEALKAFEKSLEFYPENPEVKGEILKLKQE